METISYVVQQGDHLAFLSARFGFDADTAWGDPSNKRLVDAGRDPNMLCPGDVFYFPTPKREWLPVNLGESNRFSAKVPRVKLRLSFRQFGKAVASAPCLVHGLAPPDDKRQTDDQGTLKLELPVHMREVVIEFPNHGLVRTVRVGHLDPASVRSGVCQRLRNLGYLGETAAADAIGVALAAFQQNQKGLTPNGVLDDPTRKALVVAHGS